MKNKLPGSGGTLLNCFLCKPVNIFPKQNHLTLQKNSIRGSYNAISKKHIPRYLAEFCYRFNRRFDLGEMIERLACVAPRTAPMPQRLLKLPEARW